MGPEVGYRVGDVVGLPEGGTVNPAVGDITWVAVGYTDGEVVGLTVGEVGELWDRSYEM